MRLDPPLPALLDLGDGGPPIRCRDAHQAALLAGLYRAWRGGVRAQLGLGITSVDDTPDGIRRAPP